MNLERFKERLEVASNVAVVLVAAAFLATLTLSYFTHLAPQNLKPGLQMGQKFATLPQVDYGSSENTLLLVLNTKCDYCRASIPFYRRLLEAQHARGGATRIVSLFPTPNEEATRYVEQSQMPVEVVGKVDFDALNLTGTPTMILLDKGGVVKNFWVGKIPENEEAQVLSSLFPEHASMR